MATAMARHARILWVDPPVSPLKKRPAALRPRIVAVNEMITRLTPVALPGLTRPVIRLSTGTLVRLQVHWGLRRMGSRPHAVVASHLDDLLGRWGNGVVNILYGTDDYVAGARLMGVAAKRLRILERRALAKADAVVVVSPGLAERWAALGIEPALIPNGCPASRLNTDVRLPAMPGLPAPVVGLIGQLSERIDLDILEALGNAGFSLLIVGPHDSRWEARRFKALIARPCVHYTGRVGAEAVPSYLAAVDVGITPYRNSPFNRASFPLKTLEYLAAGRPVVTSDLPAARWLRDDLARSDQAAFADQILALAENSTDFIAAVRRITGDRKRKTPAGSDVGAARLPSAVERHCTAFADRHSWSRRADDFAALIGLSAETLESQTDGSRLPAK